MRLTAWFRIERGMAWVLTAWCAVLSLGAFAEVLNLDSPTIVPAAPGYDLITDMLADEIEARTQVRIPVASIPGNSGQAQILLGRAGELAATGATPPAGVQVPDKPDGFAIWVDAASTRVYLAGHDRRGVLFAAGRLIRLLQFTPGRIAIDDATRLATAPRFAIRGHQVGYRTTPNSYDAWTVATYEQYVRDQAVFGGNCVEFTPSMSATERKGHHMSKTAWEMTGELIALLDAYGLDAWIWQEIPNEVDLSNPVEAGANLNDWRRLLERFEGIDAVFVPGGDGGLTPAPILLPFLRRLASLIQEIRPGTELWVSNQTFEYDENDYLFDYLATEKPQWLTGVVYGPWTKLSLDEMRERTPAAYPIRLYPDITHTVRAQYPVPEWDRAFAHGLNREAPNPRPRDMQHIFTRYMDRAGDAITYSEGVNDDLNKFVWTALGWDPETPLASILHDYGKVFFGDAEADTAARGLLMLEENWRGPIATNTCIAGTLELWKGIAERNRGALEKNWRLQMYLMRAYYDAYLQERAGREAEYESQAYAALGRAGEIGVAKAIAEARGALARIDLEAPAPTYRKEIETLCAMLFETIGMQLSVDAPYFASGPERGAVLDTLDFPLNNRRWLEKQFDAILAEGNASARQARIDAVLLWENPGEGSYYDDLGNPEKQPHLVRRHTWGEDPGYVDSAQCEYSFGIDKETRAVSDYRLSWLDQASTVYKCPLQMRYEGLEKGAQYRLRITYAGRFRSTMRLTADNVFPVHDWMDQPKECAPLEFDVPAAATEDGVLDIEWQVIQEKPESMRHRPMNRGCQVAEVWLLKQ